MKNKSRAALGVILALGVVLTGCAGGLFGGGGIDPHFKRWAEDQVTDQFNDYSKYYAYAETYRGTLEDPDADAGLQAAKTALRNWKVTWEAANSELKDYLKRLEGVEANSVTAKIEALRAVGRSSSEVLDILIVNRRIS